MGTPLSMTSNRKDGARRERRGITVSFISHIEIAFCQVSTVILVSARAVDLRSLGSDSVQTVHLILHMFLDPDHLKDSSFLNAANSRPIPSTLCLL